MRRHPARLEAVNSYGTLSFGSPASQRPPVDPQPVLVAVSPALWRRYPGPLVGSGVGVPAQAAVRALSRPLAHGVLKRGASAVTGIRHARRGPNFPKVKRGT